MIRRVESHKRRSISRRVAKESRKTDGADRRSTMEMCARYISQWVRVFGLVGWSVEEGGRTLDRIGRLAVGVRQSVLGTGTGSDS